MPGISIHLAASNAYLEKHPHENREEFILGSISPDMAKETAVSHHSAPDFRDGSMAFLLGKVNLRECLADVDLSTSFGRGYLHHLITDYEFFHMIAKDVERIEKLSYRELKDQLYHDYTATSRFFKRKYKTVFPEAVAKYDLDGDEAPIIINLDETCAMIARLSEIDFEEYVKNL